MNNQSNAQGQGSPILAAAVAPVIQALEWGPSLAHNVKCAADHFAPWMIDESWFRAAVESVRNGTLQPMALRDDDEDDDDYRRGYSRVNGVAVVSIAGPIMKKRSKYGGTSSVTTRAAIRKAVQDAAVHSILLHIDSPGGTVAGTADLAADVKAADAQKPVYAHIDDLGASAAYWVASQARRITANSTAEVGSIGTLLILDDTSGMYAAKGVKVHVISTGKYKGAGADGAPVTEEHLAMFQESVDDLNEHFVQGVAKGRGMALSQVRAVADGRCHISSKAMGLGLIDGVCSADEALAAILKDFKNGFPARQKKAEEGDVPPVTVFPQQPAQLVEVVSLTGGGTSLAVFMPAATTGTSTPNFNMTFPQPSHLAPEASSRVERDGPPPAVQEKESNMASEATTQQAAPALNPAAGTSSIPQGDPMRAQTVRLTDDAIGRHTEHGKAIGRTEGRNALMDEIRAIVAACPGRPQTALNAILAGQNASTVKLIVDAEINAEMAANKRAQEQELEIAKLRAEQARLMELNATGGHPGVPMSVSVFAPGGSVATAAAAPAGLEPRAQAELEWDSDPMLRAQNGGEAGKKSWLMFREQQLKGNVKVLARKSA